MNQATEQPKTEQPQKGWVTTTYRHYKGKRLGPYHYRRWKVGSKIHRQYIKPSDVERIKAECAAYSEQRRSKREGARRVNVYLDNWIFQSKMYFRFEQGKEVRPDQEAYIIRLHNEGMYITGRPLYRPRRVFGDPLLSNFISECILRNLNPLEAQMLWALGADIDQIERILKTNPGSQERKDAMHQLFTEFQKQVTTQVFGDPTSSSAISHPSTIPNATKTANTPDAMVGGARLSFDIPVPPVLDRDRVSNPPPFSPPRFQDCVSWDGGGITTEQPTVLVLPIHLTRDRASRIQHPASGPTSHVHMPPGG